MTAGFERFQLACIPSENVVGFESMLGEDADPVVGGHAELKVVLPVLRRLFPLLKRVMAEGVFTVFSSVASFAHAFRIKALVHRTRDICSLFRRPHTARGKCGRVRLIPEVWGIESVIVGLLWNNARV